jgi:hypothetical protein
VGRFPAERALFLTVGTDAVGLTSDVIRLLCHWKVHNQVDKSYGWGESDIFKAYTCMPDL